MATRCKDCPPDGRCLRCQAKHSQAEARRRMTALAREVIELATGDADQDLWLLPDDGLIDQQAVRVAASGERPVMLTWRERERAGAVILARGGTPQEVCKRLSLPVIVRQSREEIWQKSQNGPSIQSSDGNSTDYAV